jgi:hypothetical protein
MYDNNITCLAEAVSIVSQLIFHHEFDSLIKVEFSSLMIVYYLRHDIDRKIINTSRFDRVHHFFGNFLSVLFSSEEELKRINEAIHLLEDLKLISVNGDKIRICGDMRYLPSISFFENEYICNTLVAIKSLSNKSFIEEVVCNV